MQLTTSIAVLPFRNMSNDPSNDFFCEGISEEIIHALARIEQLKVICRTSSFYFKDHPASLQEIGTQLDVQIILEGSVRMSGATIRISVQLIQVADNAPFWSQRWDRPMDHLFEVQDEISLLIADQLRELLGHLTIADQLLPPTTTNLNAYQHYLKGRYHFNQWNAKDARLAVHAFQQAVALDPSMIHGYLGLADAYSFLAVAGFAPRAEAWAQASQALDQAARLDADHAGLNYMLAHQALFTQADFSAALTFALKALSRESTFVDAQRLVAFLYTISGQFKLAKDHVFYAKSIDPLHPETLFYEAYLHYRMKKPTLATPILDQLITNNPHNLPAIMLRIWLHLDCREVDAAQAMLEVTPAALFTPDERLGLRCLIDLVQDHHQSPYFIQLHDHAKSPTAHHAHAYLFLAYALLDAGKQAFALLDHVWKHQSPILLLHFGDPLAESLQDEAAYATYHKRLYPPVEAASKRPNTPSPSTTKAPEIIQVELEQLHTFMTNEQPFLNPTLTLRTLASHLNMHPNQLSWLLNEQVGKNFNTFINQHRIEHFKQLVVQPSNAHISLLGLAYESGFNSKTVFNTAFKKEVGMTPKAYQKRFG